MKANTSLSNVKGSIRILCLLITILALANTQDTSNTGVSGFMCLLNEEINYECINNLNVQNIMETQPESVVLICPILVKYYQQNEFDRDDIYSKVEMICKFSTQYDIDNAYLLLGFYMMANQVIEALRLQYKLFFADPFQHQNKFNQIISKYSQLMNPHIEDDQKNQNNMIHFKRAICNFYRGKFAQAKLQISLSQKQDKIQDKQLKDFWLFFKVRVMEKINQFPSALQYVNKIVADSKSQVHWYLYHLKGNLQMHHIRFDEAIQSFQKSISMRKNSQPVFAFSLYNIGICYQKTHYFYKSFQYFSKILIYKPNLAEALNSLAFSYAQSIRDSAPQRQNQEYKKLAQKYYKKSIQSNQKYYLAYYNYGIFKLKYQQHEQAKRLFQLSLKINSSGSNLSSKYGLFKALYKLDKQAGLKYVDQEIKIDNSNMYFDLGVLFQQVGENTRALEHLKKNIQNKYKLGDTYEWKGIIQFQMQLYFQAYQSFKQALQYGNTKHTIWFNLGYIDQLNKNYQKALGMYKKSIQLHPQGPAKEKIQQMNKILSMIKQQQKEKKKKQEKSTEMEL